MNNYVVFQHDNHLLLGKVSEILAPYDRSNEASHVAVSQLEFHPKLHPKLHVPCIRFTIPELKIVVPPKVIHLKHEGEVIE